MSNDIATREKLFHILDQEADSTLLSDFSEVILNMIEKGVLYQEKVEQYLTLLQKEGAVISHSHKRSLLVTTKKRINDAKVRQKFLEKSLITKFEKDWLIKLDRKILIDIEYFKKIPNLFWEKKQGENKIRLKAILYDLSILKEYLEDMDEFIEYNKRPHLSEEQSEKMNGFQLHLKKSIKVLNTLQNNLNNVLFLVEKKETKGLSESDRLYLENKQTLGYITELLDIVTKTSGFFENVDQGNIFETLRNETENTIRKEKELIKNLESFWKHLKKYKSHKSSYNVTRVVPETFYAIKRHVIGFYYQAGEKSGLRVTSGLLLKGLLQRDFKVRRIAIGESAVNLPSHTLFIPRVDMGNVIKDLKKGVEGANYKHIEPKILSYYHKEMISDQLILLPPYFWTFFPVFGRRLPEELSSYLSFGPGSISKEEVSWNYVKTLKKSFYFFTRSPLASEGLRQSGVRQDRITFTPNMFNESMIRKVSYLDRESLKVKYLKERYSPGSIVFSAIGRISGEKNLQSVFSAMSELLPTLKNAVFVVVGDILGIESQGIKGILERLLQNPDYKGRVIMIKGVDHESALELVHMSDITFSISGREACNTLTIEALALGTLPIVLNATTFPGLFADLPVYVDVQGGGDIIHSEAYFDESGKSQIFTDADNEKYRIHPSRAYWRIYIPDESDLRQKIFQAYKQASDQDQMEHWKRKAIEYSWHTFASNVVLNRIARTLDR